MKKVKSVRRKMTNRNSRFKTYLFLSLTVLFCAFCFSSLTLASEPNEPPIQPQIRYGVVDEPTSQIERICTAIYKGDFAAARELLEGSEKSKSTYIAQLRDIVSEYEAIEKARQSAREAAYREQLAELEKLRTKTETGDVNDVNSVSTVSDINDISEVLLTIAKASELANEQQKPELMSNSFVKETIQKAIDKAAQYESQGKWLDAYITCYSWLQAIEPNNQAYTDYANKLIDKANIEASFQDSPCETRTERFQGIEKEMFIRAIDYLKVNYVDLTDYRQMAIKAIERCQLLGQVLRLSSSQVSKDLTGVSSLAPASPDASRDRGDDIFKESFSPIDSRKLSAWSAALAAILWDEVDQSPTGFDKDKFVDVFEKVLALNSTTVEIPEQTLIAQFADAAFSVLDPYTVMIWPRQVQSFEKTMTYEFTGIGIEITKQKGLLTVASLLPDTPAYNSGLDADDVVEKVDGIETKDMTLTCAVAKITGPKGTKVTLTIRRQGEEKTRDITITRAKITVPTIRGWQRTEQGKWLYMIDDRNKIGYVRITSFAERTSSDLEKVLGELEAEGLKGLILDLRFNAGGLLDSAVEVVDKFIREGPIVRTERGFGRGLVFETAHEENTHPDYSLVLLLNYGSASASEIVGGALADPQYNRAILVGVRTHGKGSVQGITHYPGGGAQLKYTMAYYHLPSGQRVESQDAMEKKGRKDWGVGPHIEVDLRSDELKKMIDVQRNNDVLVRADHDNTKGHLKKHTAEETLSADPQLAVGVLVIRSKLIQEKAKTLHQTVQGRETA